MSKIQPYTQKNFPRICQIYNASKLDELAYESAQFELIPLDQDARRLPAFLECQTYVYVEGNEITGYVAVCSHNQKNEIRGLFVHPEYRGRGIAKKLMRHVFELFSTQDLQLNVVRSNKAALALYQSLGFEIQTVIQGEYNGIGVEVLTMRKTMLRAHQTSFIHN